MALTTAGQDYESRRQKRRDLCAFIGSIRYDYTSLFWLPGRSLLPSVVTPLLHH